MKKSFLTLSSLIIIIGTLIASCNSSAEKIEKAEDNVIEARKDLTVAREAYLKEIEDYRLETADKINTNNTNIIILKAKIEDQKKDVKAMYKNKLAELELKNSEMKKKMEEYKSNGKENWDAFKTEFNHDMEELGKAFNDLTINNTK